MEESQYPSLDSCRAVLANLSVGDHSARANSSPVHVIFSHYLPGFLDPVLQSVLNWMVTHDAAGKDVEGRPSNRRRFSATQIAGGYQADGRRVSWGCGCNRGTVIRAMNTLEEYRIIRRIGDARSAKKGANGEFGCLYELELNYAAWDWEKMRLHREESDSSNRSRSQKARQALEEKRASNPSTPKPVRLTQSKRSVTQTDNSSFGLSHNPTTSIHSVAQTDTQIWIGLSHNPISDQTVAQSDPEMDTRLSHNPIISDEIAPQTKTASPLINEFNKELNNKDILKDEEIQKLVSHYCWAFSRDGDWQNHDPQLSNGQTAELSEWVDEFGFDQVRKTIDTVSRLPNPPILERAFGLVRHYLKKPPSARSKRDSRPTINSPEPAPGAALTPLELEDLDRVSVNGEDETRGWKVLLERLKPSDRDAMNHLRGVLRRQMERNDYNTWFDSARLMGWGDDGGMVFGLANSYTRDWVEGRLKSSIERILTGILACETRVSFQVVSLDALEQGF